MSKVDIYICSKPLQYLNICNIPSSGNNKKILIVCDAFYKALEFTDSIREFDKQWDRVILVKGWNWVFHVLRFRVDKLYWGLDTTIIGAVHFIKRFKFFMYEEGAGTYKQLRIQNRHKLFARLFGTGEIMGKSKYLQAIYVYYPEYYVSRINPSCPVLGFTLSNREIIKQNVNNYLRFYGFDKNNDPFLGIKNSNILLYITDWEFQISTIEHMREQKGNFDYLFIKPHPHIKTENIPVINGIDVIYTNIVVEMILQIWLEGNNKITVFHQDSTAIIPFGKEIHAVNVSQAANEEYHQIIEDLVSFC